MSPTESRAAITVNRPIAEVFAFWHDVQNLPRFLEQLQSVRDLGGAAPDGARPTRPAPRSNSTSS